MTDFESRSPLTKVDVIIRPTTSREIQMQVSLGHTVGDLKDDLANQNVIIRNNKAVKLIFAGRIISDDDLLLTIFEKYDITIPQTIHLIGASQTNQAPNVTPVSPTNTESTTTSSQDAQTLNRQQQLARLQQIQQQLQLLRQQQQQQQQNVPNQQQQQQLDQNQNVHRLIGEPRQHNHIVINIAIRPIIMALFRICILCVILFPRQGWFVWFKFTCLFASIWLVFQYGRAFFNIFLPQANNNNNNNNQAQPPAAPQQEAQPPAPTRQVSRGPMGTLFHILYLFFVSLSPSYQPRNQQAQLPPQQDDEHQD
ncbi:ubiquitin domain-containing protein [Acrasis kona]|uniref:Ubiquitin domain-containing protein n=1 Tax=Acrasis kona TaxID=1008807 RepID=A0AAW2YKQ0_9EUKA